MLTGKCKSASLHDSRRITQSVCAKLSEKRIVSHCLIEITFRRVVSQTFFNLLKCSFDLITLLPEPPSKI